MLLIEQEEKGCIYKKVLFSKQVWEVPRPGNLRKEFIMTEIKTNKGISYIVEDCRDKKTAVWKLVENGINLEGAILYGIDLSGINFEGVNLSEVDFRDCVFKGTNFNGTNLEGANFNGANLVSAVFNGANLEGANFKDANLVSTDFDSADLEGANFYGADLTCAVLYKANLRGVNFNKADLTGANFKGANLESANLDDASWPLSCQSLYAIIDDRVRIQMLFHAVKPAGDVTDSDLKELLESELFKRVVNKCHMIPKYCAPVH